MSMITHSLESIKTGHHLSAPRIVLYGVGGIGKTTFGASIPGSVFLPTEDGFGVLDVARFPMIRLYTDLYDALVSLTKGKHDYKCVVIDSFTVAERLIWQHVAAEAGKTSVSDIGYQRGYVLAVDKADLLLDQLDQLRDKGIMSLLICHAMVQRFDDPEHEPYDRYLMQLHQHMRNRIYNWADAVLFANYKVYTRKKEGSNKQKGIGEGERTLYTTERPPYAAKNRFNLPDELEFTWNAVSTSITNNNTNTKTKGTK